MKRPGFIKRGERVRLQTFLARSGVASRRAAEEMITHGRIAVNGETVTAMGLQVVPGVDRIEVDGEEVKVAPTTWIALHKPKGYVTTRTDPFGRRTVYDLLPEKYHGLFHVGRLDRDSEGLLLLTNDGDLANRFLHPSYGITKEYDVIVTGKPTDATLRELVEGVELEDGVAKAESAKLIGPAGNGQSRLKMVLREGKKREVRRMLEAVGHEVTRLVRRRFGPVELAELPKGKWRVVAPEELSHVRVPRRAARAARRDEEEPAESPKARGKAPARAAHNAYGDKPGKRHETHAGKRHADAARPSSRDEGVRPRKPAAARDEDFRPRGKSPAGERPKRTGARAGFDADAPPRKRPAAPSRGHTRDLDDWADAPRVRGGEERAAGRRPGQPGTSAAEKRIPAPRGKVAPRDRAAGAFDRAEREERARGKTGSRDRAAGEFDRDDRPARPRGRTGGEDRPPRGRDRDEGRGGWDEREERRPPSRGGFGREEPAAGPRGRAPDREGRPPRGRGDEAPAPPGRFEREERAGARARPSAPREPAFEVDADEDELDSWSSAPRRRSGARGGADRAGGGRPGGARGGAPARGGRPGGRPSAGGKPSGGKPSGGRPGAKGGGKPGGARGGPGKPRRPGGGGGRGR